LRSPEGRGVNAQQRIYPSSEASITVGNQVVRKGVFKLHGSSEMPIRAESWGNEMIESSAAVDGAPLSTESSVLRCARTLGEPVGPMLLNISLREPFIDEE
jgi:hypothetical protein